MEGNSDNPSVAIPEFSSALATTLSAAPAAFALVDPDVVACERVPVTTVIWDLNNGMLEATISARERDHGRAINRKRAPATTLSASKPCKTTPQAGRGYRTSRRYGPLVWLTDDGGARQIHRTSHGPPSLR
jgi:hypothetical protein